MNKYREYFIDNAVEAEQKDIDDGMSFLTKEDYEDVINSIENEVNNIKDMLEPIKGLVDIDEIKEEIKKLSKDLY